MNYVVEYEYSLSLFMENLQAGEPPSNKLISILDYYDNAGLIYRDWIRGVVRGFTANLVNLARTFRASRGSGVFGKPPGILRFVSFY